MIATAHLFVLGEQSSVTKCLQHALYCDSQFTPPAMQAPQLFDAMAGIPGAVPRRLGLSDLVQRLKRTCLALWIDWVSYRRETLDPIAAEHPRRCYASDIAWFTRLIALGARRSGCSNGADKVLPHSAAKTYDWKRH